MIPLYIPYVNRADLLLRAIESIPHLKGLSVKVINNSGEPFTVDPCETLNPPVALTFSQTQNWMLRMAHGYDLPFYLFMHSDAEAGEGTVGNLIEFVHDLIQSRSKWGCVFTNYDALAAFNTEAMVAIGGWDTMLSWYGSDCDCYRRLKLAGYELVESNLPVKHTPSQTLNSDPETKRRVDLEIPFREAYYRAKWGGPNGNERYAMPFNEGASKIII